MPVFAIICGVLIGMGGAYVVKKLIFGGNKKRVDVAMIEEGDRVSGRSKLKREARIRQVETAEVNDDRPPNVEPLSVAAAEASPLPTPVPGTRALPRSDPSPVDSGPKHTLSSNKKTLVAPPSKAPIRVTPAPKLAMVNEPPPTEPVFEELKMAPKLMTIRNLTYSRQLFNRCSEDCLLLFRAADGGAVKAKLKKSSFMRVLSNNLAYADIDGYESNMDGERIIVVKSIRGMPVVSPPSPAPKHELTKSVKEEKVAELPKVEKKKEVPARDTKKKASDESDSETAENPSIRSRLESSSKSKKKEDSVEEQSGDGEEEEGSSFQNRLKKSLD